MKNLKEGAMARDFEEGLATQGFKKGGEALVGFQHEERIYHGKFLKLFSLVLNTVNIDTQRVETPRVETSVEISSKSDCNKSNSSKVYCKKLVCRKYL